MALGSSASGPRACNAPLAGLEPLVQPIDLLVTGASGFLGQALVKQAVAGDQGRATVWGTWLSNPDRLQIDGVQPVCLDITDSGAVLDLLSRLRPHTVVHTAYSKHPALTESVVVSGTRHVAQAAAAMGSRLIHISSDVIFDGERAPYDEAAEPAPLHDYGRAKAAAEAIVRDIAPDAAIVRTSLICGLNPRDRISAWIIDSLQAGTAITLFTDEVRTPVWVEDLAAAVLELADTDFQGIINVAGPQSLSRHQMGVRLARYAGLEEQALMAGLSRESGLLRPRDCRLDTSLANQVLRTRLRSYDEGLSS